MIITKQERTITRTGQELQIFRSTIIESDGRLEGEIQKRIGKFLNRKVRKGCNTTKFGSIERNKSRIGIKISDFNANIWE